jgi:predicted DNA-binding transcriptional regulator YafY
VAQRRRLLADRFRRIWAIVERIDRQPGLGRRQLAAEFALSERQLQADLIIIRDEMGLPLERRQGYRFSRRRSSPAELGLEDAMLLSRLTQAALERAELPSSAIEELLPRLAGAFPARFQPFARAVLAPIAVDPAYHPPGSAYHAPNILLVLAQALLQRRSARVHLITSGAPDTYEVVTIEPQLLVPYGEFWYVIGYSPERERDVMLGVHELDPQFVEIAENS